MLTDLLRMIVKDAGRRNPAGGPEAANQPFVLRLLGRILPILIFVDLFLFWRGIFTGGAALAIVLFALRFLIRAGLSDVEEAERETEGPAEAQRKDSAAMHPFDRAVRRVNLAGRLGVASFLGLATTVLFLAGTMTMVSFVTKYFQDSGYLPERGRAEATVLERVEKCRIRGRNGAADTFLDAALCQLRREGAQRREIVSFLTIRYPLPDGTVHVAEAQQYKIARGRVASGDTVPITYGLDNPDDVRKRNPHYWTTVRASLIVPFVMLVLAYGAARWRRHLLGEPSPAGGVVKQALREREETAAQVARAPLAGGATALPERAGRSPVATFMTGPRSRRNGSAFGIRRG